MKITRTEITTGESEFIYRLHQLVHNIERLGDLVAHLVDLAEMKVADNVTFSAAAQEEVDAIFEKVDEIISLALNSMKNKDKYAASGAKGIEDAIDTLQLRARNSHIDRMNKQICSADQGVTYLEYISDMERLGDYGYRIAQFVRFNL